MTPFASNVIANGTITINGVFGNSTGSSETLTANNSGSIVLGTNGQLFGPLNLTAAGKIGTGAIGSATALKVNSSSITAHATGALNINDVSTGNVVLNGLSGSSVALLGMGTLIQTAANSTLSATNGALSLEDFNMTTGAINIAQGTTITTAGGAGGNVDISIGPPTPGTRTSQTGITVTGASAPTYTANFGNAGITVHGTNNTIDLIGASTIITTGPRAETAIVLGPGVGITADPLGYVRGAAPVQILPAFNAPASVAGGPTSAITPISSSAMTVRLNVTYDANGLTASARANDALITGSSDNASSLQELLGVSGITPSGRSEYSSTALQSSSTASAADYSITSGIMAGLAMNTPVSSSVFGGASTALTATSGSLDQTSILSGSAWPSTAAEVSNQNDLASLLSGINSANLSNARGEPSPVNGRGVETPWLSETELMTGKVPAIISSDLDFGIQNEVSTVVDLQDSSPVEPTAEMMTIRAQSDNKALAAGVSHTVNGTRTVHLKKGAVVFAPTMNTIVYTELGQVRIAAHSLVLMISFKDGVAIYDLDDQRRGAVTARVFNHEIPLGPGRHILITHDEVRRFENVNPVQMLGYNNVTDFNAGGGLKVFAAAFSLPSAMQAVMPLNQLVASNHPHARRISNHLLKTAALLTQLYSVEYQQVLRPSITAYQQ